MNAMLVRVLPYVSGTWVLRWVPQTVYVPDESTGAGTVAWVPRVVWIQVWELL